MFSEIFFDELEILGSRTLHRDKFSKMAASTSKTQAIISNSVPIEDALSLLDSGFFDCDEEMLQQVNSLESDVSIFYLDCLKLEK